LVQFWLDRARYEVIEVHTGLQHGMDLVCPEKTYANLMDLSLPVVDSWMAAHELKATF